MTNPFYIALGISKFRPSLFVRATIGLAGSVAGSPWRHRNPEDRRAARPGDRRHRPAHLASSAFAIPGARGGDFTLFSVGPARLTAFEAIMGFDGLASAFQASRSSRTCRR
jgi:hypothetical protein